MPTYARTFTANFGRLNTGVPTVGYTLTGGSRVTAGVTEPDPAHWPGVYGATVLLDVTFAGAIVWDLGDGSGRTASEDVEPLAVPAAGIAPLAGTPDPQDLTTAAECAAVLSAGGVALTGAQLAVLPTLITDASKLICRWCRRYFALTTFDEIVTPDAGQWDRGEADRLELEHFPVVSVLRVGADRTPALSVTYAGPAPDAWAAAVTAGDPEVALTPVGLTLSSVLAAVQTDTPVFWSAEGQQFQLAPMTIDGFAAAVGAVGGGWQAASQGGLGPLPAVYLYCTAGPQGALPTSGLTLSAFATTLGGYKLDARTGCVHLPPRWGRGPLGDNVFDWPLSEDSVDGPSWRGQYRVRYTAGWAVIPEPVRRACCELVKYTLERVNTDASLQSETRKDYSYAVRQAWEALPPWVAGSVSPYRRAD